MKIEVMSSKQDLIDNLKKAAKYSGVVQLKQLAEYIQQELTLDNLKDGLRVSSYEIKIAESKYQVVKYTKQFDSTKNVWQQISEEVIEEIEMNQVTQIKMA